MPASVDTSDYETRVAKMLQMIYQLARIHGCTVETNHEGEFCWISGPDENQIAMAQALADNLDWCEDIIL